MEQKEYTYCIVSGLVEHYPSFASCYHINSDNFGYINYKSAAGKLTLLISTRDNDLTIGFAATPERFGWHVHMSQYGAKTPEQELQKAIGIIDEIIYDRVHIVFSSKSDHFIPFDVNDIERYRDEDESFEITKWSNL